MTANIYKLTQYCRSGMIYSGTGSSLQFYEFWIRIQPILCYYIWRLFLKNLKFNQKEESTGTNYLPFLFHTSVHSTHTVTQSRIHRPTMIKKCFIDLLFHFQLDPCGSGSATLLTFQMQIIHGDRAGALATSSARRGKRQKQEGVQKVLLQGTTRKMGQYST